MWFCSAPIPRLLLTASIIQPTLWGLRGPAGLPLPVAASQLSSAHPASSVVHHAIALLHSASCVTCCMASCMKCCCSAVHCTSGCPTAAMSVLAAAEQPESECAMAGTCCTSIYKACDCFLRMCRMFCINCSSATCQQQRRAFGTARGRAYSTATVVDTLLVKALTKSANDEKMSAPLRRCGYRAAVLPANTNFCSCCSFAEPTHHYPPFPLEPPTCGLNSWSAALTRLGTVRF
jgi:hypothetical protein